MKPFRKVAALFRKGKLDVEMSEELRAHLELQTAENLARGMPPDEARYAAQRSFGGIEQIKERCRDERRRGFVWFDQFSQDARYAGRSLRRNPGFTAVTVVTLALGIGASTALFTFVNALVLRTLPVSEPERVVQLQSIGGDESFSYAAYERFRDDPGSISATSATSC